MCHINFAAFNINMGNATAIPTSEEIQFGTKTIIMLANILILRLVAEAAGKLRPKAHQRRVNFEFIFFFVVMVARLFRRGLTQENVHVTCVDVIMV